MKSPFQSYILQKIFKNFQNSVIYIAIRPEETMAFGDQLNDLEMLDQAYYSFAVANAREEVRRAAIVSSGRISRLS